jgi:GTP-binding protein Era
MKYGTVLLIGRPNVGKSTFLNNLLGHKVAITSPKPQTTRFPIQAIYEDERGELMFIDTPGIFGRAEDFLSKQINEKTLNELGMDVDVVLYMVDHTRRRDFEESKVLGIVRKLKAPKKILVVNKIDMNEKSYAAQYRFLEDEVDEVHLISALEGKHVKPLLDAIFESMPERAADYVPPEREVDHAIQNIDSRIFIGELVREKIFLHTGKEVPYTTTVIVDEIADRPNGVKYIKARILTTHDRYKKMIIGKGGEKIKDLGRLARKEIELAINTKVFLDLTVETDPHWQETFYG